MYHRRVWFFVFSRRYHCFQIHYPVLNFRSVGEDPLQMHYPVLDLRSVRGFSCDALSSSKFQISEGILLRGFSWDAQSSSKFQISEGIFLRCTIQFQISDQWGNSLQIHYPVLALRSVRGSYWDALSSSRLQISEGILLRCTIQF